MRGRDGGEEIRMTSNLFKAIFTVGPNIIFSYFAWMIRYSRHKEKYPYELRYNKVQNLVKKVNKALGMKIEVVNADKLPKQASCIISNHVGTVDPITYIGSCESPITFVCKIEISKYPFTGRLVKIIEGLFLDRGDLKQSLRVMMKVQDDLSKGNKHWLIFPEGTRNKDINANLLEFHHGTFRAPMKANVPIVPSVTYGSFDVFKKPNRKYRPIYIEYGDPIYPKEYKDMSTQEVAALVQSRVQQMLTYHARKRYQESLISLNKK